jgi:hypothetical protein
MTSQEGGGFLHPTLPTPPASVASPQPRITLPQPRTTPLKPGGTKESNFINYVEGRLLAISGRYERRGEEAGNTPAGRARSAIAGKPGAPAAGYHNFAEVAVDLEGAVDVVWVSGTRMSLHPTSYPRIMNHMLTHPIQHLSRFLSCSTSL